MSDKLADFSVHLPINTELMDHQEQVKELLYDFNHARPSEKQKQKAILEELFGSHNGVHIVPPFYCDMGSNIHFKQGGFLNTGVTILDIAPVHFGEYVQLGPNVVISTAGHPTDLAERVQPIAIGNPITIGDNVWIGAGAVVVDGVTIGDRSVIGAGSVVTKDIPADSVAVGVPCRVVRTITHGEMPSEEEIEAMWQEVMAEES